MMLKIKNQIFFFWSLITVYFLQGSIYPKNSVVSQIALLTLIIISLMYLYKCFKLKNKSNFFRYWTVFIFFVTAQFLITGDFSSAKHTGQLKNTLFFMLPFYPIYYWTRKKKFSDLNLNFLLWLLLPTFIIGFFTNLDTLRLAKDSTNVVNNLAYLVVALIPYLFCQA